VQTNDAALQGMNSDFGWYFGQVRVDPQNAQRSLRDGGLELWRTDDAAHTLDPSLQVYIYPPTFLHVDHQCHGDQSVTGTIWKVMTEGFSAAMDLV
jgi:hypothetical protein